MSTSTTTRKRHTVRLVTYGPGVHCLHYDRWTTLTGYASPGEPLRGEGDDYVIPPGTPVIDYRPAVATAEGHRWAWRGPMVDVARPESADAPNPGPLDWCSIATYLRGWRAVGARIGEYHGGGVLWEEVAHNVE